MKCKKITKSVVDASKSDGKAQLIIWDSELKGFGLRITPTRKTYVAQSRIAGKTVRVTIGLHGPLTPEQARNEAKKILGEMCKGINPNDAERNAKIKGITLKEAYVEYIKCRTLKDNTLKDYDKAMRLSFHDWADKAIQSLSRDQIIQRFDKLSINSKAQANQKFRFLKSLLNFAKQKYASSDGEQLMPSNPCDILTALKKWHRIPKRTSYIQQNQLKPWFAVLVNQQQDSSYRCTVKDYCIFVLLCGCREQEGAQLLWENVDLENSTVTFKDTKNHLSPTLPVGTWLKNMLVKRYNNKGDSPYVFPSYNNRSGHLENHRRAIQAISMSSDVKFSMHDLRRSFISIVNHQLAQTFSSYTIKKLLNHKDNDVTAGYIQFGIEDLRRPMQLLETFVLTSAGLLHNPAINNLEGKVANDVVYLSEDNGV